MIIGDFISNTDRLLNKEAFVPAQVAGGGPQMQQETQMLSQQTQQLLQSLPPEAQQTAMQQLQQIESLPPQQQQQALQQINQGLQQMVQQGQQQQQQPGGQQPPAGPATQQGAEQQAPGQEALPPGHLQAENDLDNTKVTLSVRELMDLTSGGKATQSHLKVKQLVDSHNQKMQQTSQQMQQDEAQAQAEQQAMAAQGQQGGGLYPTPPDMSGKAPQQGM